MATISSSTAGVPGRTAGPESAQDGPHAVPQRMIDTWAANDPDAFAELFAEDATLILPQDVYLSGREEIRAYMAAGFAGPMKGSKVAGKPLNVKYVGQAAAVLITQGGVLYPGDTEVKPDQEIRATWVLAKQESGWVITAYQNTRIRV